MGLSFRIQGPGGRLLCGSRLVAEFGAWTGGQREGRGLVVSSQHVEPDPYWWDHHDASRLTAELDLSRPAAWFGPARIVAKEPLMFQMEVE